MSAVVELQPIGDTFASEAPEIEVMGDFARLTFWTTQEDYDGSTLRVVVARIIVPIEIVMAFIRPPAQVIPFKLRAV